MHYEINHADLATITHEEVMKKVSEFTPERGDLADLGRVDIDAEQPLAERFASFIEQIKNPYLFMANGLTVQITFDGEKPLTDALKTALAS